MRRRPKVIVVDDDLITLNILSAILKGHGFQVRVADNAAVGLKQAQTEPPDLIILDVCMPEKDGLTALAEFRNTPGTERTRVLMLTSEDKIKTVDAAFQLGANGYIVKPFDRPFLEQKIAQLLLE